MSVSESLKENWRDFPKKERILSAYGEDYGLWPWMNA